MIKWIIDRLIPKGYWLVKFSHVEKLVAEAERRGYLKGVEAVKVGKAPENGKEVYGHGFFLGPLEQSGWNACVDALEAAKQKLKEEGK